MWWRNISLNGWGSVVPLSLSLPLDCEFSGKKKGDMPPKSSPHLFSNSPPPLSHSTLGDSSSLHLPSSSSWLVFQVRRVSPSISADRPGAGASVSFGRRSQVCSGPEWDSQPLSVNLLWPLCHRPGESLCSLQDCTGLDQVDADA